MASSKGEDGSRPMTSVGAAGYKASDELSNSQFKKSKVNNKNESEQDIKMKELENKIRKLLAQCAQDLENVAFESARDKALQASKLVQDLMVFEEQFKAEIDTELNFCVDLHMAICHEKTGASQIAIEQYKKIMSYTKSLESNRFRVNIGNIYFRNNQFAEALKMYRMAADQVSTENPRIRAKILHNVGRCLILQNKVQEAISSYEAILDLDSRDFKAGLILLLILKQKEDTRTGMKEVFTKLVSLPAQEDKENNTNADNLKGWVLKEAYAKKQIILNCSKNMLEVFGSDKQAIIAQLAKNFPYVVQELDSDNAIKSLKNKQFSDAQELFEELETKSHLSSKAANCLSFIHFSKEDYEKAQIYANKSNSLNMFNHQALVNQGNANFLRKDLKSARECYIQALNLDSNLFEACFNLGRLEKEEENNKHAIKYFERAVKIKPDNAEVKFQLAFMYEQIGSLDKAERTLTILTAQIPTDPSILSYVASVYSEKNERLNTDNQEDLTTFSIGNNTINYQNQAVHYYSESFRYLPNDLNIISWLGIWYVKNELYEKAIHVFFIASEIEPTEVKWELMITSCYRRMGRYHKALELYEEIHTKYPNNPECLKYLATISKELNLPYEKYETKLMNLDVEFTQDNMTENVHAEKKKEGSPVEPENDNIVNDDDINDLFD